jgi:starch synthase
MKIVYATSEMVPFSKTGGLADVAGALPAELANLGHEVVVFTPYYREVHDKGVAASDTGVTVHVPILEDVVSGRILRGVAPGGRVTVYFVDAPVYFDREGLYQAKGVDHPDNSARFVFFTRAILEAVGPLGLAPDLFHLNDWQTALAPVYLRTLYKDRPFASAATLLTIHNLGYQGLFWHWDMKVTGLPWVLFDWKQLEFWGHVNFLKGGIVFADALNTVSKTYAKEIQTEALGVGLHGALAERKDDLFGVTNGIDTAEWNPAADPHLPAWFTPSDLSGKEKCKQALLKEAGLARGNAPLFGMITRLTPQKGVDLLLEALDTAVGMGIRLVILGTGDPAIQEALGAAESRHPGKVKAFLAFDNRLAHRIEAGADAFLMPSRYEPCGLNQLMSLRYGTVPVVRRTGGLADTVVDASPADVERGEATGFVFEAAESAALLEAIGRAAAAYKDKALWRRIVRNGMAQDWSWKRSAQEYATIYGKVLQKRADRT